MVNITVLMPAFNASKYIATAIQSILTQSFTDFELLIIDDGSTDNSLQVIQSFKDKRIRIIQNEKNLGLIKTLNKGIKSAKGKYIARMDADDISLPQRLEKQFNFLEQNPQFALVGTQATFIRQNQITNKVFEIPTNSEILPIYSLFYCPFVHPSVMIRTDILKNFYYSEDFTASEDYELWTRILRTYKGKNLAEALLQYRIHDNNSSNIHNDKQIESVRKIYQRNLEYIGMPYNEEDLDVFLKASGSYHQNLTIDELQKVKLWLLKMHFFLLTKDKYKAEYIKEVLKIIWFDVCVKATKNGIKTLFIYLFQSDFKKSSLMKIFKLVAKCLHHKVLLI